MRKIAIKVRLVLSVIILFAVSLTLAGAFDPPAGPTDPGSAMFTLNDLYNRLNTGATGVKRSGAFTEPTALPGSTMHNLNDIMAKAPAVDNFSGAGTEHVASGKTFWGLQSGKWGLQTGTLASVAAMNITPSATEQTITAGIHDGTGRVAGDVDLIAGNIRAGVNLFGVTGSSAVVNTGGANATAGELLYTRTAYVNGQPITGTLLGGVILKAGGSFSPGRRWYDNADGTITDVTTGLVWLKNLSVSDRTYVATPTDQIDIFRFCGELQNGTSGLTDGSRLNDWRPPTIREMQSLRTGTEAIGGGNWQVFSATASYTYWTVSSDSVDPGKAQTINMATGALVPKYRMSWGGDSIRGFIWPVRGALLP